MNFNYNLELHFVDIDFETRSELDVREVGARKYAEHPSTEVVMMSFSIGERPARNWNPFTSKEKKPNLVLALVKAGWLIRAHHSEFEYWIWNLVCTRQFGFEPVPIEQFYDTMAMSCAMAFPAGLEAAGEALDTEVKKDKGGTALINFFSKPSRKKGEHFKDPLVYRDKFNDFIAYCDDDVNCQVHIAKKTCLLSPFEHEVFILTEKMNVRGIPIDIEMCHAAIELAEEFKEHLNKRAKRIIGKDCPFDSLTQTGEVKAWLNSHGCKIPNMQANTITEWLNDDKKKIPRKARTILKLRSDAAMTSISKYKKLITYCADDGRIHGFIKYYIARTGRWGGRGVQIQNFPRPGKNLPKWIDWEEVAELIKAKDLETLEWLFDDLMAVLSGALRAAICAPDGYKFVSADYSQIEARLVMWFSDCEMGLKEFGGEGKIYEGMASEIYKIPKPKIGKESFERFIGKQVILGAGFGMGPPKFVSSCKEKGGVDVELELAKKGIDGYRKRYPEVKEMWTEVEKLAIAAVRRPGAIKSHKHVKYQMRGEHLYCLLPSGRELCYPYAYVELTQTKFGIQPKLYYYGVDSFSKKWVVIDTWGGKLTENFVQAAARDIMAHGLINCDKNGYTSLFTVHDEGVSLVKEDFGSYKEYEKLMCELPDWAKTCPIEAEGWEGKRYRK